MNVLPSLCRGSDPRHESISRQDFIVREGFALRQNSGLRLAARGVKPALGAFLLAMAIVPAANALPAPVLDSGGCTTTIPANTVQVCRQTRGLGEIFSQATPNGLSATAWLDVGPYAGGQGTRVFGVRFKPVGLEMVA